MKALTLFLSATLFLSSICCAASITPAIAKKDTESSDMVTCHCADGKTGKRPATSIIGNGEDDSTGCECDGGEAVSSILSFVVNTMSIGVGILGVIGISITGVQYLTAGDSEEKVRKAKQRMFEIIIGLAAYAIIFALLQWLIPNFKV